MTSGRSTGARRGAAEPGATGATRGARVKRGLAKLVQVGRFPSAPRLSAFGRYGMATVAATLAFLVQLALFPLAMLPSSVCSYAAIVVASWMGGRLTGLFTVALSAALADAACLGLRGWTGVSHALDATALFVGAGSIVALLCSAFRASTLRAEQAARSLRRQSKMLALSHDAILVWKMGGPIESWSSGAEEMYGYSADEALGRDPHTLLKTTFPQPWSDIETALRFRGRWDGELTHLTKDGRSLTASTRLQLAEGPGEPILQTDRDVTESRQGERALRESERRLGRSQAIAHLGSWELDVATGRLLCSDEAFRIFGYQPQELEPTCATFLDAVHPDDRAAVKAAYEASLEPPGPSAEHDVPADGAELEHRIVRGATGEVRTVHQKWEHVRDASGELVRSLGTVHDITERKQAEERVRELNRSLERRNAELNAERMRWQGVVEGIADEVWVCDAQGTISLVNEPDSTLLGADGIPRKPIQEVLTEVDILGLDGRPRPAEDAPLLRSLRTGNVVRGEDVMRHRKTGEMSYRQYSCAPTRDATGAITGAVAIVRDVTQFRQMEQALREADRRKDEFLGMLSHELRNPLAPIRNSLYILKRTAPDGQQQGGRAADRAADFGAWETRGLAIRALATIDRQTAHLARIVDDLLDVSRITRGKIDLHRERLDLREVVERTLEDYRHLLDSRHLELHVEEVGTPVWVNADATRLTQALANLLQNAAKFTPAGGDVFVRVAQDGPRAVLAVRDTGVGIAPEVLPRLFEPFAQADRSLDRTSGGLGLGLALVKGLVGLHGGDVRAVSEGVGRGTEVTLAIPVEVETPQPERARPETVQPQVRHVLVIEDNTDAAETLKDALELDDHFVTVASTGPEGLAKARAVAPDVVLCDIGLPGMDGYQVARAFRADDRLKDVPLVALTGYASSDDRRRAASAGFDHHLAKPPNLDAIERLIAGIPNRRTA